MSRERYQLHATLNKQRYTIHPECINTLLLKTCKRFVNFAVGARSDDLERQPVDGCSLLKVRYPNFRDVRINDERGKARSSRQQVMQQLKPFCRERLIDVSDAGDLAARPVEARHKTVLNRVEAGPEDDRNGGGRCLGHVRQYRVGCDNHASATGYQISREFAQPLTPINGIDRHRAVFDSHIAAFDEAPAEGV